MDGIIHVHPFLLWKFSNSTLGWLCSLWLSEECTVQSPRLQGFSEYRNDVNINMDAVANAYNPTHLEGWDMIASLRTIYRDPVPNNLKIAKKNLSGLVKKQNKTPSCTDRSELAALSKPWLRKAEPMNHLWETCSKTRTVSQSVWHLKLFAHLKL